jgi:hypothetical protein
MLQNLNHVRQEGVQERVLPKRQEETELLGKRITDLI